MAGRSTRLMTRFFAHQSCTITIDISKPFKHNKTENNLPHRTPHKTATALARLDMGMQLFVRKKKKNRFCSRVPRAFRTHQTWARIFYVSSKIRWYLNVWKLSETPASSTLTGAMPATRFLRPPVLSKYDGCDNYTIVRRGRTYKNNVFPCTAVFGSHHPYCYSYPYLSRNLRKTVHV